MKEIFNEYGSVITGTLATAGLLVLVLEFVFGGDIYNAILEFSTTIC